MPEAAILQELQGAGAGESEARSWWAQSCTLFQTEGFLASSATMPEDVPPADQLGLVEGQSLERIPPCVAHRSYRLFDTFFRIGFTGEDAMEATSGMLTRLVDPGSASADVEITVIGVGGRFLIARGMRVVGVSPDLSNVAGRLEMAIVLTAIDMTPHLLSLHSGALARGGCGLLLTAPSGSGKTTLTAALNHRGWSFGTDEITLLDPAAETLRVAPLSACVKDGSWPVLQVLFQSLANQPVQLRAGRRIRYLPPVGRTIERCVATHVVFPRYAAAAETTALTPLPRGQGLQRLFAECVSVPRRLSVAEAEHVVNWARGLNFYDLSFADLSTALAALDELADGAV